MAAEHPVTPCCSINFQFAPLSISVLSPIQLLLYSLSWSFLSSLMSSIFPFLFFFDDVLHFSFSHSIIIPAPCFFPIILPSTRVPQGRPCTPPGNAPCLCLMNDRREGGGEAERERGSCGGEERLTRTVFFPASDTMRTAASPVGH